MGLRNRTKVRLAMVGLAVATLAVYANSFRGPFVFDDLLSIPQNSTIHGLASALKPPSGGETVTGRPILNLSFALNYAISGEQVWSYHAVNWLIHALAGLTLFGIVRRTVRGEGAFFCAVAAALLWLVHPLQTESVTYIVQRAESLMGLFYLFTLYAFVRGAEAPAARGERGGVWFALSVGACLAGMGTKEVMVSAPVIVLLYDRTFLAGSFREAWRRRGPVHGALLLTWIPLAMWVAGAPNRGGTSGWGVGVGFGQYWATQFQAVMHYLWLAVWPRTLIADYGVRWVRSAGEVVPYALGVGVILVVTVGLIFWRTGKGEARVESGTAGVGALGYRANGCWGLGFLGVWFFAILAPTSLVPGMRQTLAEHRMYLALAPVVVLVVLAVWRWLGRRGVWVVAAAAIGLGCATFQRNDVYRSEMALWRDTVTKRPGNAAAHNNYGNVLSAQGQPTDALAQYEEALKIDPQYVDAWADEGNALVKLERPAEAIPRYEAALQIKPNLADVETGLGNAYAAAGRDPEAAEHYGSALRIDPNYTDAGNDLGLSLMRMGHPREAEGAFEAILRLKPLSPDVENNLGNALLATGDNSGAILHFQRALKMRPDFAPAHNNLGNAFRAADRQTEAIGEYEAAIKLLPYDAGIQNNLGISLLMAGRASEAIDRFEQVLRMNPNDGQVHRNLAIALASVGRNDEAEEQDAAAKRLGVEGP
jgi:tetratricopeptide (TPR) repeat protein